MSSTEVKHRNPSGHESSNGTPSIELDDTVRLKRMITLFNGVGISVGSIIGSGIFVFLRGVLERTGSEIRMGKLLICTLIAVLCLVEGNASLTDNIHYLPRLLSDSCDKKRCPAPGKMDLYQQYCNYHCPPHHRFVCLEDAEENVIEFCMPDNLECEPGFEGHATIDVRNTSRVVLHKLPCASGTYRQYRSGCLDMCVKQVSASINESFVHWSDDEKEFVPNVESTEKPLQSTKKTTETVAFNEVTSHSTHLSQETWIIVVAVVVAGTVVVVFIVAIIVYRKKCCSRKTKYVNYQYTNNGDGTLNIVHKSQSEDTNQELRNLQVDNEDENDLMNEQNC